MNALHTSFPDNPEDEYKTQGSCILCLIKTTACCFCFISHLVLGLAGTQK